MKNDFGGAFMSSLFKCGATVTLMLIFRGVFKQSLGRVCTLVEKNVNSS